MESLTCKNCRRRTYVAPGKQQNRCHGCQKALSVGSINGAAFFRTTKQWRVEIEKKKSEAKLLYQSLGKKFSNSNNQHRQIGSPSPSIITPEPLPRGKRAFLCGVTYKKQKFELKGTAHDVKNMRDLLVEQFSFRKESILILAEDESFMPPTRKNIEDAFQWLMRSIQSGDSLVFYFSGHGLRQRDHHGDEIDGFDETICPVDFQTNGMILDNYINQAIVRSLIPDVTLHAIVDSCHSGTVLDLPHVHNINTGKWDDNRPPSGAFKGTSRGRAICFSACEDYQLAADTSVFSPEKEMTGAMTCTFIRAIKSAVANGQNLTYHGILDSMHKTLKQAHKSGCLRAGIHRVFHRKILQDPLLSSSEEFSIITEFKL
ncbi:hypothetical protein DH2020_029787 [Rehmannia glutinosa]|uniref:Peptidase C14 caspase domain-containing protein n=1 Tax=Rehmannia glutinosa TaxID=99300 RepID=A0ABR0VMM8_REHGL